MTKSGKRKRTTSSSDTISVIGGKDLHKLQKLVKLNTDDTESVGSKPKSQVLLKPTTSFQTMEPADNSTGDAIDQLSLQDCLHEMPPEFSEDWDKFFRKANATQEFASDLQKNISESRTKIDDALSDFGGSVAGDDLVTGIDSAEELSPEVISHLRLLTDVLKRYRSGRLPKTLKVLPNLPGWDGLLEALQPLEWTPHVYPRVIRVFAAKGNEPALYFYSNCLLPRVRRDIEENKRLSIHLFEALIGSMFRPEEFVSGIFLPWMQSEMTKVEGVILANLLKRASLKSTYASVALVLGLDEEFSIPRSLVIEALLSKKYHLPQAALTRVAQYFLSFDKNCHAYLTDEKRMPVIWFKTLLQFLEAYRNAVKPDEREAFFKLCRRHEHPQITPEIRALIGMIPSASSAT